MLRSRSLSAVALIVFQVMGLLIPLLTLPILSSALGVQRFGEVMLAQAIVLMAVLWVDSGFNAQSQQAAAHDLSAELKKPQALIDNLIARSYAALQAVAVLALVPLFIPLFTYQLLFASLPLVLGTLLFPQWWLLAMGHGFLMGLVTVVGRAASAILIWWLVQNEHDAWLAALCISCASLASGCLVLWVWLKPVYFSRKAICLSSWRLYVKAIKPTLLPAFLAAACAQLPLVALGAFVGAVQAGLFSAADRLTRAGAHLLSLVEQTLVTQWLQPIREKPDLFNTKRQRILVLVPVALSFCLVLAWWLSPWIVSLLYQDKFNDAVTILRVLLLWLWLQSLRRLLVAVFWLIHREIKLQARIQWFEIIFYLGFVGLLAANKLLLAASDWGLVTAWLLCLGEACLIGVFVISEKMKPLSPNKSQ